MLGMSCQLPVDFPPHMSSDHTGFIQVVNTKEKTAAVLDSLDNELRRKKFVALWQKYTQLRHSVLGLSMETWTEIRIVCSRQEDGHSCGVFTLMNAKAISDGTQPCVVSMSR